jgi:hypothetical protein
LPTWEQITWTNHPCSHNITTQEKNGTLKENWTGAATSFFQRLQKQIYGKENHQRARTRNEGLSTGKSKPAASCCQTEEKSLDPGYRIHGAGPVQEKPKLVNKSTTKTQNYKSAKGLTRTTEDEINDFFIATQNKITINPWSSPSNLPHLIGNYKLFYWLTSTLGM